MDGEHIFVRDEVYPSWFVNALGSLLSVSAFQLKLVKQDATHIQIPASIGVGGVAVAIQGRWRWMEANVVAAHPGGAAGTYDIYLTASETNIVSTPAPFTDTTNYAFGLQIKPSGITPTISPGTVDVYRKVGTCQWDGSQITQLTQTVPAIPPHASTHATGGSDPIAPSDIGATTAAYVDAETARAEAAEGAEAIARANADATLAGLITTLTTALSAEVSARIAADTVRIIHVAVMDDQTSPPQPAGSVVGHVPVSILGGGDGWVLKGVISRAIVAPSGTASVYKVQCDHGSSGGVLSDVPGLGASSPVTPAVGRAVRKGATGGSQALSDTDTVALVMVTPGTTKGIAVAFEFERTHT